MSTFYNMFCYFLLHIIIAESSLNNITNDDIEKQHISELLTQQGELDHIFKVYYKSIAN